MEYDVRVDAFGCKKYFKLGTTILHREDGPAIEYANGDKEWYIDGVAHREDGPAIEHKKWYKAWYINGNFHRTDGPAIEYFNDDKYWFINGERLSPEKEAILNKWWNNKNGI